MNERWVVFDSREIFEAITKELCVTEYGSVWIWYEPENEINVCTGIESQDGKFAIAHPFSDEDWTWLQDYTEGTQGVTCYEGRPEWWVNKAGD